MERLVKKAQKGDNTAFSELIDVKVTPTYIPEGYVNESGDEESEDELAVPSQYMFYAKKDEEGKLINGFGIEVYNAAKIDNVMSSWNREGFTYKNVSKEEETKIQNLDTRIFTWKDGSENGCILMFNSMEGYMISIQWGFDSPEEAVLIEEMKKVAEGLEIEMLDEEVQKRAAGVDASLVKGIGESFAAEGLYPATEEETDKMIEITVSDVQICDSIQLDEYQPAQFRSFEKYVAPVMNEDGTLKSHDRLIYDFKTNKETNISSKYVIVKVKETNTGSTDYYMDVPMVMPLQKAEEGNYRYLDIDYRFLDSDYWLQWTTGMLVMGSRPICFSEAYNYEEVKGQSVWGEHMLKAGEEKEYTLIYAVDEDVLSNIVLTFDTNMKDEFVDISGQE